MPFKHRRRDYTGRHISLRLGLVSAPPITLQTITLTTAGTFTHTTPSSITGDATITVWGASGTAVYYPAYGRGGAGGGACSQSVVTLSASTGYSLQVGDKTAANNNVLRDSWWGNATTIMAKGGRDGGFSGGFGGAAASGFGTTKFSGGAGGNGEGPSGGGGGGGGGAGILSNGGAGGAGGVPNPGDGGTRGTAGSGGGGQGGGGINSVTNSIGSPGTAPGGAPGGHGAAYTGGQNQAGVNGQVKIEYMASEPGVTA